MGFGNSVVTRKAKKQPTPAGNLTRAQIDKFWDESSSFRESSDEQIIANALSGKDRNAASAYLYWLRKHLKAGTVVEDSVRKFSTSALDRFFEGKNLSLGQSFGLERGKKGNAPVRPGAHQAIVRLVRFLHDEYHYPLAESVNSSAFEVASVLLARKMEKKLSASTIARYWKERDNAQT